MKPVVDESRCIGCGLCAEICPTLFKLQPEMYVMVIGTASDEAIQERLEATLEYCPVQAISLA